MLEMKSEIMTMKGKDKSGNVIEINLGNSPAYNPALISLQRNM